MTKPLRYMLVITGATLHSDNESDDDDDEEIERKRREGGVRQSISNGLH